MAEPVDVISVIGLPEGVEWQILDIPPGESISDIWHRMDPAKRQAAEELGSELRRQHIQDQATHRQP